MGYKFKMSRFNLEIGNEFKKFLGVAESESDSDGVCNNVTTYKSQYICADTDCTMHIGLICITVSSFKHGIILIEFLVFILYLYLS